MVQQPGNLFSKHTSWIVEIILCLKNSISTMSDTDIDTVVKFFILILIFVFDPLAVSLVIAANIAFEKAIETTDKPREVASRKRKFWEVYKDKKDIPTFSEVEPDLPTDVEFDKINDAKRVDREKN